MASSSDIHKQEFRIRDLTTRSVLLFPTRAQIIRDIKEIILQPGPNQIVIDGLTPTVDEHSIKVEGTGSATITDVAVDLLPNRELYDDIYPSEDDDSSSDDNDNDDSESEPEELKAATKKIKKLRISVLKEQEIINSAATRLTICDNFGKFVGENRPPPDDLEKIVSTYNQERAKIYQDHEASSGALEKFNEDIADAEKEKVKLSKAWVKASKKKEIQKSKALAKKYRKKAEVAKEKQRIRDERDSFWPKKVYRVTINLEPSSLTPGSSRRSSLDGDTIVNLATSTFHEQPTTPLKSGEINISLSYITHSAFWSPRYDLNLNTVKCSGLLEYGAEIKNTTSEIWKDAKVVLSTSQTSFSGLNEKIPIIEPWHVRLHKNNIGGNAGGALMSQSELQAKRNEWSNNADQVQKRRWELFGRDNILVPQQQGQQQAQQQAHREAQRQARQNAVHAQAFGQAQALRQTRPNMVQHPAPGQQKASGFGGAQPAASTSLFGSAMAAVAQSDKKMEVSPLHRERKYLENSWEKGEDEEESDTDYGPGENSLAFEEGEWEESGMTTTYDVPGVKTLSPSNSAIKHKIAKVEFKNIIFSHIVIGKLRQVAFLKARIRNTSKITLLRGPLGLTLDGSFLGQATFPRCSAGESFSLPLGVDPAIKISYPKPTVRRRETGLFSKEQSNIFTRSLVVTNTKHNSQCEITVLDQVPVSEEERLHIDVITPAGLKIDGEAVLTGTSTATSPGDLGKGSSKDARSSVYAGDRKGGSSKWGSAIATAKKGGEVCWNVKLNPGQGVKLVLEYQATFPSGEKVVGAAAGQANPPGNIDR